MRFPDTYFITGTAYAGKSTMVKMLAEKYDGIFCGENYHNDFLDDLDPKEFPGLTYTRDLVDWHDFVRRSSDEYAAWVDRTAKECEILELRILEDLVKQGRKIFVDTNICVETLHEISDERHVLIMLADPQISVSRFFDRPDAEKQFLYRLMLEEPDPDASLANFRECLKRINSPECYKAFQNSGFSVLLRDDARTPEQTLAIVEQIFGLEANT